MSTNGETADLMVREGIQITESALKLAGLGAKNLAALLIALANDNQKLAGKTNLKRLIHDGENHSKDGCIDTETMIRRLNFPGGLKTENAEQYAALVEALGGDDNAGTRLWWDTGINW